MNFLELINKCLLELNYKPVNLFSELVKNDHKKIMTILNIVNKEICNTDNWNFLLRKATLEIPADTTEVDNTINGRILYMLIGGKKYRFVEDFEPFLTGQAKIGTYSVCNDKLLFPASETDRIAEVIYYTKNCVTDAQNNEKEDMTSEEDCSLIPMPYVQQLLVYGTCLRLKANPSYIRFGYWMSMYKEALLNLKSKTSVYSKETPSVRLFRH